METGAPVTHNEKVHRDESHVLKTPAFMFILWGIVMAGSFTIFVMGCWLAHGAYLDEMGLGIAISLITLIVVPYMVLSEKIPALSKLYHIIAVLVIQAVMIVLWLATWAAIAARRAGYKYDVRVEDCFSDGSTFNSNHCTYARRSIEKRGVVFFKTGLAVFAAMAGIGALVWLLFIACFVVTLMLFLRARKDGRFAFGTKTGGTTTTTTENHQMTGVAQQQPVQAQAQYPQGSYDQGQYAQGQYPPAGQPQGQYPPVEQQQQQYQTQQQHYEQPQGQQYQQPEVQYQQQPQAQYQQGSYTVSDASYSAQQGSELAGSEQHTYTSAGSSPPPQQQQLHQ